MHVRRMTVHCPKGIKIVYIVKYERGNQPKEVREGVVRSCDDPALRVLDRYWKMSCNLESFS
jgi:hypothetical protein